MTATTEKQRSIARPVTIDGRGLFLGEKAVVRFSPAPVNHGVVFVRMDVLESGAPVRIPALVTNVTKRQRRTTLRRGAANIETCEHVLSAITGVGIDNLLVEITGQEFPGVDGSAQPYVELLTEAGLVEQDQPRRVLTVTEPVTVQDGEAMLAALPADEPYMQV